VSYIVGDCIGDCIEFGCFNFSLGFPINERSRSLAFITSGQDAGAMLSMLVSPILAAHFGWQTIFYACATIGLIWNVFYYFLSSSSPELHKWTDSRGTLFHNSYKYAAIELKYILANRPPLVNQPPVPWKQIVKCGAVWAIITAHFCHNWGLYVMLSWLPTYHLSYGKTLTCQIYIRNI
jgi:ACS family sodium-dependent inorganic phosphate cotransporter